MVVGSGKVVAKLHCQRDRSLVGGGCFLEAPFATMALIELIAR